MEFFNSAVDVLKTLVVALGAGLGVWGAVNLMESYGGDNPSAKAQGMNELATNELAAAKEHLTTEEYEEILAFGANW